MIFRVNIASEGTDLELELMLQAHSNVPGIFLLYQSRRKAKIMIRDLILRTTFVVIFN